MLKKHGDPCNATSVHANSIGHPIDWPKSIILAYEKNWKRRKIREAMTIKRTPNTINIDPGVHISTTAWIPFISSSSDHIFKANEHTHFKDFSVIILTIQLMCNSCFCIIVSYICHVFFYCYKLLCICFFLYTTDEDLWLETSCSLKFISCSLKL